MDEKEMQLRESTVEKVNLSQSQKPGSDGGKGRGKSILGWKREDK